MSQPTRFTPRFVGWMIAGIGATVAVIVIVTMVTDANNRERARMENNRVHEMVINGQNPGYSQRELDSVCAKYPEAC